MADQLDMFVRSSLTLLKTGSTKGRYCHALYPSDNSPSVVHDKTNQLTYVVEGEGRAYLNGVQIDLAPGDSVFVSAGTAHSFKAKSPRLVLFHIHVPDEGRDADRRIVEGEDYDRHLA